MTIWYSRQIMDVGELYGELEIAKVVFGDTELAGASDGNGTSRHPDGTDSISGRAGREILNIVEQEERDRGPIYFGPNIAPYTR
jgi:hypothetical protein